MHNTGMNMVEVFKTNMPDCTEAERMLSLLHVLFRGSLINFDLHDCDKILRVEASHIIPEKVIEVMERHGYQCQVLE